MVPGWVQPGAQQAHADEDEDGNVMPVGALLPGQRYVTAADLSETVRELVGLFKPEWAVEAGEDVGKVLRSPVGGVVLDTVQGLTWLPLVPMALRWWRRLSPDKGEGGSDDGQSDEAGNGGDDRRGSGGGDGGRRDEVGRANPPGLPQGGRSDAGQLPEVPGPVLAPLPPVT